MDRWIGEFAEQVLRYTGLQRDRAHSQFSRPAHHYSRALISITALGLVKVVLLDFLSGSEMASLAFRAFGLALFFWLLAASLTMLFAHVKVSVSQSPGMQLKSFALLFGLLSIAITGIYYQIYCLQSGLFVYESSPPRPGDTVTARPAIWMIKNFFDFACYTMRGFLGQTHWRISSNSRLVDLLNMLQLGLGVLFLLDVMKGVVVRSWRESGPDDRG